MRISPSDVDKQLDGWLLFWAHLELLGNSAGRRDLHTGQIDALRREVAQEARERFELAALSSQASVAALRRLFRAAGCDPTRYRPSSEALLRRLLKGDEIPRIHPLVDFNNCLSAQLAAPCCVMDEGSFEPPLTFRSGRAGESYVSLRGPFSLEGKPLLCDAHGPLDAPIAGNERVKISNETRQAWLVCYLPEVVTSQIEAAATLENLAQRTEVIRVSDISAI